MFTVGLYLHEFKVFILILISAHARDYAANRFVSDVYGTYSFHVSLDKIRRMSFVYLLSIETPHGITTRTGSVDTEALPPKFLWSNSIDGTDSIWFRMKFLEKSISH